MLSAVGLFFGGALKKLLAFLGSLSLWQAVSLALAVYCGLQFFELKHARAEATRWEKQFESEHSGRLADRKAYQQAQIDAAAKNKAQVQQIEQQQQKVTDDVEARYRADLARLLAGSVRPSNPSAPGSSGNPGAPETGSASGGPDGQALPLSGPELLQAQQTELQLNALIDWVQQQSQIDPNK